MLSLVLKFEHEMYIYMYRYLAYNNAKDIIMYAVFTETWILYFLYF